MRLVAYNILNGGEGRADPLAEVIEAQRPDIIALTEAEDSAVLDRIAGRLKMDCVQALGNENGAAAILSHWKIQQSINHAAVNPANPRAFLEATIVDPSGFEWVIGVLHLHAQANEADETFRERELEVVLKVFAEYRRQNRPHLLVGDFNSNSPLQRIDIEKVKRATRESMQRNGGKVPRRVVQRLLEAGYVDSLHAFSPRLAESEGSFSTQYPGQRVDYIFAFGLDQTGLRSAWIERDRLARYASDHFPVGVEWNAEER